MKDFGLYIIITKPALPYCEVAQICVANDIKMLQLREKDLPDRKLLEIALEIREITKDTTTKFIINDRPDIASLCNADMVHLGQDDLEPEAAKQILDPEQGFGISTHSLEQAKIALQKNPAYIGFGPVFKTPTKAIPDPVVGTEKLKQVLELADIPVVAIGGIFPENIEKVLDAGAKNIAMVRYFMESKDLDSRIKKIKTLIEEKL